MGTNWTSYKLAIYTSILFMIFQVFAFNDMILVEKHVSAKAVSEVTKNNQYQKINVILERVYLDGEVSQESIMETIKSRENFWAKYDDWQLIHMEEGRMIFRKKMDDISPLLKANGYFGITDEGVLTIFNGRPHKENIIQSFFQIDLGRLESKKCEELKKGIPIKTKEHYVEVLETFKTYTTIEKQAN